MFRYFLDEIAILEAAGYRRWHSNEDKLRVIRTLLAGPVAALKSQKGGFRESLQTLERYLED